MLISLFDPEDYSFAEHLASAITHSGHGCDFEIEKISEEKGLKRIKSSKNLIEKEEAPESIAKVAPTKTESKKVAFTFNSEEPWTGVWDVIGYHYWSGKWALKQTDNKIVSTEESLYKIEGLAVKGQLKGKIIKSDKTFLFTIKISSDGLNFEGSSTDYYGRSMLLRGTRME